MTWKFAVRSSVLGAFATAAGLLASVLLARALVEFVVWLVL